MRLQCPDCATSNRKKDVIARSARLIRQAEGIGYFLPQDQCVQEEMAATQTPNLSNVVSETTTNNSCCWSKILSLQSDFTNERPLLQEIIEDAWHICLFLPKFHCKLNPIELFWSYIKQSYRKQSHQYKTFKDHRELFKRVRQTCPTQTIRQYFCRIDRQISAYQQGYNGPQSVYLMKKYKSHRCIPRNAAMSINVLTS
ncbi:hypothetical protein PSTG_06760 [Puccinia striiformis f. sp. tritici PST-78]|uniref:Tc1-like transposase DDE domain-containing protein n=1 Tax=Puccinia striiformis f. sp. tritici PST-78 TaxID=1165861 RepID=A0A0L0VKV4_9BASI|nr:hypothetical protein PSTG_06760 [Puccinia striiformis f. sp. tritici PST-78]